MCFLPGDVEAPDYEGDLPRMDSNHDKVIQSLLCQMIGYEPI
jgi:hypothetical protein